MRDEQRKWRRFRKVSANLDEIWIDTVGWWVYSAVLSAAVSVLVHLGFAMQSSRDKRVLSYDATTVL